MEVFFLELAFYRFTVTGGSSYSYIIGAVRCLVVTRKRKRA